MHVDSEELLLKPYSLRRETKAFAALQHLVLVRVINIKKLRQVRRSSNLKHILYVRPKQNEIYDDRRHGVVDRRGSLCAL